MNPKYKLIETTTTISYRDVKLYRICALRDFGDVKAGDLGGFVELEANLSHQGDCWIYNNAKAYGYAQVFNDARISGSAVVSGNARVYHSATVDGNAIVTDHGSVYDEATVNGRAIIGNHARIYGEATITDDALIIGSVMVDGTSVVAGRSRLGSE